MALFRVSSAISMLAALSWAGPALAQATAPAGPPPAAAPALPAPTPPPDSAKVAAPVAQVAQGAEAPERGRPRPIGRAPSRTAGRFREAPNHEVVSKPVFAATDTFPLAGYHQGHFYLRDPEDRFRFFPGALLQIDGRAAIGRGVTELDGPLGEPLRPRVSVRRAQPMIGGQIGSDVSFLVSGELAGSKPRVDYALVDLAAHRLFHVTVGQQLVPFTMANRTYEAFQSWMEQPLVVRFARPVDKDLGVLFSGELPRSLVSYEAGVFGGDGAGRPNVDNRVDLAGRVTVRPLAQTDSIASRIQIGGSVQYGVREINKVGYHLDALTTEGGFAFWDGARTEGGQRVAVVPSGEQLGIAGELRVPVSKVDFRFEVVYQKRQTRESVEGLEQQQSLRFGHLTGTGFYTQLAFWVLGDPTMIPEPFSSAYRVRSRSRTWTSGRMTTCRPSSDTSFGGIVFSLPLKKRLRKNVARTSSR